ncbi:hypothetical protein PLESTM_000029300 [Pleodorina starrii]|nr:hypothetical protein PLESTM_000029300 [Pleodorina starrii]
MYNSRTEVFRWMKEKDADRQQHFTLGPATTQPPQAASHAKELPPLPRLPTDEEFEAAYCGKAYTPPAQQQQVVPGDHQQSHPYHQQWRRHPRPPERVNWRQQQPQWELWPPQQHPQPQMGQQQPWQQQ